MDSLSSPWYNGVTTLTLYEGHKMSHYIHFSTEEREMSMIMIAQGLSLRAVARELKRSPSTISRELKRNSNKNGKYLPSAAEKRYRKRRKNCGRKSILSIDSSLKDFVVSTLKQGWSPDEISERMKLFNMPFSISYITIYRAIAKGVLPKQYRIFLRIKRVRNRKHKKEDKRGKIADRIPITERPIEAENRLEIGHWEGDSIHGKRGTGSIGTYVDRASGLLLAFKVSNFKDNAFTDATVELFSSLPAYLRKTCTVDNGNEFAGHKEITAKTGMIVYFCNPHSPWQRGTNENTNGLLRQYFPKGSSFEDITDERLAEVVNLINNRPRKRLGYKTPLEVFKKCCT